MVDNAYFGYRKFSLFKAWSNAKEWETKALS